MIALLDVNMLIALFDAAHVHHQAAHGWMAANRTQGWATCPVVQNGCLRVMSQPSYPGHLPVAEIARRLRQATASGEHVFWPDTLEPTDSRRFRHENVLSSKSLTDVYLLGLAVHHDGRLVTFDRTVPLHAVVDADPKHLVVL